MKTLKDELPIEFVGCEYTDTRARKYADVKVIRKVDGCERGHGWPGNHAYVMVWYELENGVKVGFNENPSVGWSFPCIGRARKV